MPFLEVLTRACKRPRMLAANQASLRAQTCGDWVQTLLVDEVGRGIGWSHENMAAYAPHLVGDYIWCLDDDDLCILETFVADLQLAGATQNADLIMVRMDHGPLGILPPDALWGQRPVRNHIGMSAFVAARSLWQRWAHKMVPGKYDADYELVSALFDHAERVIWLDVVASRVQQIGLGRPEPQVSVVMPTLGRAAQAARCIRGLFETASGYAVECIVVCRTDDTETPAAVRDIPGVIVLQRDQDDPITAWNQGAEIARGEWLVLGADDVVFGRGLAASCVRSGDGWQGFHWPGRRQLLHALFRRAGALGGALHGEPPAFDRGAGGRAGHPGVQTLVGGRRNVAPGAERRALCVRRGCEGAALSSRCAAGVQGADGCNVRAGVAVARGGSGDVSGAASGGIPDDVGAGVAVTGRHGDGATGRHGDGETRGQGDMGIDDEDIGLYADVRGWAQTRDGGQRGQDSGSRASSSMW